MRQGLLPRLGILAGACVAASETSAQEAERYSPFVAPPSDEGQLAIQGFESAPGIELELFAAEPMLANPVCFYADHRGDFFVAETFRHHAGVTDIRDHMDWLDEDLASAMVEERLAMLRAHEGEDYDAHFGTEHERVRLIRDTDGDGEADFAAVFADGFRDHAAGIGAGLLSYRGDVFYACIPDLWRLRDANGDGAADARSKLSTGYGVNVALLGHDLHGLRIGPDRRLYFSCGDRGFHVETEHGVLAHAHTGAVLRCDLDGTDLEVFHTGLRNPQELAFDDRGDLFTGDNNSDGGDRARLVNIIEGGDSGWRYAYQWITEPVARGPWNDEKLWHPAHAGQAAYIVPPIVNLADGPSGLTFYPGTGLSPKWAGHFFLCDFRGDAAWSGIHAFTVVPRGAFYELGSVEPFVWKSLVTDCDFGPDGALYFTDWVHGWEKTGKGRLYRAFDPEGRASALVRETRMLLAHGLDALPLEDLSELLAHADQRVRQEAHFALAERGREGIDALAGVAKNKGPLLARLHALWGLWVASRQEPALALGPLVALTGDGDPEVRAQATRVLGDARYASAAAAVCERLSDEAPRVRCFAALAVGRLGSTMSVPLRLDAIVALEREIARTGDSDPNLRHALVMGLSGTADDAALERLAASPSPAVRKAVILVERRKRDARVARFLADPEPLLVLEAARAIHDLPLDAALPELAALEIPADAPAALSRRVVNARFRLADVDGLAAIVQRSDLPVSLRVEALDWLCEWSKPSPRDKVTNEWRPLEPRDIGALTGLAARLANGGLAHGPDVLFPSFARLAQATDARELGPLFVECLKASERAGEARIAALDALESFEAAEFPVLVRAALGDRDGGVRAAALEKLERLAPEEALPALPVILDNGEIAERRVAYRILGQNRSPRATELLASEVDLLACGLLPAELALDLGSAVEANGTAELGARLADLCAPRSKDAELAPFLDALFGGDAERGAKLFERVNLSCVRCHATKPGGSQQIGPNLAGVSKRLTRLQMLESIIAPNRHTTAGFAATVFFMEEGGTVSGRVLERSDEVVRVLASSGEVIEIDPLAVEEERADLSAMPEDVAKMLSREELRDLLAYLGSL